MCHTNCSLKRSSGKKRRAIMICLKNKTSIFIIKKCVRYECTIFRLSINTPAYYGTGETVTVGMNYLVSSCSDDPRRVLSVLVLDKNVGKIWGKKHFITALNSMDERQEGREKTELPASLTATRTSQLPLDVTESNTTTFNLRCTIWTHPRTSR